MKKRRYVFKTHKNKMVRPDDGRRSRACRRRAWVENFIVQDMGVKVEDGRVTVTVGEHELLNMAADIAVQSSKELTAEQRRELREIIGTLRRGRGKRA
ncbi:MAG TPA: hypothetical protein VGA47_08275 [Candidatus Dormibacteraeota bacterium]